MLCLKPVQLLLDQMLHIIKNKVQASKLIAAIFVNENVIVKW